MLGEEGGAAGTLAHLLPGAHYDILNTCGDVPSVLSTPTPHALSGKRVGIVRCAASLTSSG